MAKRKYTRMGETRLGSECSKKKCKWQGIDNEKKEQKDDEGWSHLICPNCGNNEFYGLLESPKTVEDGK